MSNSEYLKRYPAPKAWIINRKANRLISKPNPGPHKLERGLPIGLVLVQLGLGHTSSEVRKILNTKEILVDGRQVKDKRFPVGLFDVISIPSTKQAFQITIDLKGRLVINPTDAKHKPCRVVGKTVLKGGKMQVNLIDGRNLLLKEDVKVGDTLLLDLPSQKVVKHLKLEKGAKVLITSGRFVGNTAKVESVEGDIVQFTVDDKKSETKKEHVYVTP